MSVVLVFSFSVEQIQRDSLGILQTDMDDITKDTHYVPPKKPPIGKYVPDPTLSDISNPRHWRIAAVAASAGADTQASSGDEAAANSPTITAPNRYLSVPLITVGPQPSTGTLFFPIAYTAPTARDRSDPAGLPLAINVAAFGPDRPTMKPYSVVIQSANLDKVCLYKIGPSAVAYRVIITALEAAGMQYTYSNTHFNILWAKRATPEVLAIMQPYQRINHFPGTSDLGRKDALHRSISMMRQRFGSCYDITPATFLLPAEQSALEEDCRQSAQPPTYITKPVAGSCGRGIKVCVGLPPPTNGKSLICQRYIERPLLIGGRKFDLRIYCVVTGFDPLRIYIFDDGLVRFAADPYPGIANLDSTFAHLTNFSVNKNADSYSAGDAAVRPEIKWSLRQFPTWLKERLGEEEGNAMWRRIIAKIHDMAIKAILSVEREVVRSIRSQCLLDPSGSMCFELYGLDVLLDENFRTYLLEVNIMPSLATGTTLDKAVKSRLLAHLFTMVGVVPVSRAAEAVASDRVVISPSSAVYDFREGGVVLLTAMDVPSVPHSVLTPSERSMLTVADQELARAGGFERVFPTATTHATYFPIFRHGVQRNNYLLASWEVQKTTRPTDASKRRRTL